MFLPVLLTECLKLKRTLAFRMALIAPMVVVLLQFLIGHFGAAELIRSGRDFAPELTQNGVMMWTLLMMPLFLTLETSLLAGIEHKDRNWKSLLALPVPRWTIYVSKLAVGVLTLFLAHALLCAGIVAAGLVLAWEKPGLLPHGLPLSPLLVPMGKISIGALLPLAIQHWVSLRWQSFTTALGFGMTAMVMGFAAVNSNALGPWVPWSLPVHLARTGAANPFPVMAAALAAAILVTALGSWEFSRREIAE